ISPSTSPSVPSPSPAPSTASSESKVAGGRAVLSGEERVQSDGLSFDHEAVHDFSEYSALPAAIPPHRGGADAPASPEPKIDDYTDEGFEESVVKEDEEAVRKIAEDVNKVRVSV